MTMLDTSQLDAFAKALALVPAKKRVLVKAAVKKGAQNIKTAIQADVKSSSNRGFRRIPIAYEMKETADGVEADIAPRTGGAGSLANLAFFGTARGGGTHEFYEHGERELEPTARYVALAAKGLS
jgi:hypothetical protein